MGDLNTQFAKGYNYPDKEHQISNFFANKCATDFAPHFLCQYFSSNTARTNDCSQFGYIFKSCLLLLVQVCLLYTSDVYKRQS